MQATSLIQIQETLANEYARLAGRNGHANRSRRCAIRKARADLERIGFTGADAQARINEAIEHAELIVNAEE